MSVGRGPDPIRAPPAGGWRHLPADRIRGFDGVRALAFLGVFANHKLGIPQRDALGTVGVWTFFALSGFLITGILARSREDVEAGRMSAGSALRRFYLRRTARIFPIYYVMLTGALILSFFIYVDDFWWKEKIAYFLYATNFLIGMRDGWVGDFGHLWSLAVEEQYYLLFAPLVLFSSRRRTALLCLLIIVTGITTSLAMHAAKAPLIAIYVNSLVNFAMLGFGGIVGLLAVRRSAPAWLTSSPAQVAVAAGLIAAPLAFGAVRDQWLIFGPAVVLLAGLLLFQIFIGQGTRFVAVLDSAPFRLVGRVSYAAYLFHPFIHFATLQHMLAATGRQVDAPRPLQILIEFAATMVLSAASWRLLESPMIRWGARISNRLFVLAPKQKPVASDTARVA